MSIQPFAERAVLRDLKDPVLLTAFSSQQRGGTTATTALGYAIEKWDAEQVAEFATDSFYNYARMRPWVQRQGDQTVVHWPQNTVYRVDSPERSFLLLAGVEPMLNWREFVELIGEFAVRNGVQTAVNLKSVPAMVPHTLAAPVRAIYSSPEMIQEYGYQEVEDQDGPGDIGRILNLHLAAQGVRTIDLYAMEPFYAGTVPDASASLSLLGALKEGFDLNVDLSGMREAAEAQRRAIDTAVASSEQLRETVAALEQRAAAAGLPDRLLLASGESQDLDSGDVLREVEDIFRDFGAPGGTSEAA